MDFSAKTIFNRSAPAYEPELWNSRVSKDELLAFRDRYTDVLTPVYRHVTSLSSDILLGEIAKGNAEGFVHTGITAFNKAVEQGMDDKAIAQKFGISEEQSAAFRAPALDIYLRQGVEKYTNCYSYAMNDPDRYSYEGDIPGSRIDSSSLSFALREEEGRVERERDYAGHKAILLKQIEADGAIIGGPDAELLDGYYRVAVYTMPPEKGSKSGDDVWSDMHFVREDNDGTWSHKPGSLAVTNRDKQGKPITDPKTADIGGYEFVSFVYVPEGGLDVGPRYEPASKKGTPYRDLDPAEDWKRRESNPFPERIQGPS